jgi:hypothetical protein
LFGPIVMDETCKIGLYASDALFFRR